MPKIMPIQHYLHCEERDWFRVSDHLIAPDLRQHYHEFDRLAGKWGFICPVCKNIFGFHWAGMPGAFRAHIRDWRQGGGCLFKPKPIAVKKGEKRTQLEEEY